MNVDRDGFLVGDRTAVKAPPETVAVPNFFKGCGSIGEAAMRAVSELNKPYSYEMEGMDEFYRRISVALTVLLAGVAGIEP